MVRVDAFPQLRLIARHLAPGVEVSDEEALALYERNAYLIDKRSLIPAERELMERLGREVGGGIIDV